MFEILATFCSGTFFGAAIYISLAQHPASLVAGGSVPGNFFPPMYRRAAPMQIALAVIGTIAGLIQWYVSENLLWLVGAITLISVIPITLIFIKTDKRHLARARQRSWLRRNRRSAQTMGISALD